FKKDLIVNLPIGENKPRKAEELRNVLLNHPGFSAVSFSSSYPSGDRRNVWYLNVLLSGAPAGAEVLTEYQTIDTAYFGLYGIKMAAGRNFTNTDSTSSAIVNSTLSAVLGFKTPDEAIGRQISI